MSFLLSLLALGGSVTGSWLSAGEAHNVVDFSISAVEAAERAAAANIATLDDLVLVDACHRQVGRSQVRTTLCAHSMAARFSPRHALGARR